MLIIYIIVEAWRTDIRSPTYFVDFVALHKSTHASYVLLLCTSPCPLSCPLNQNILYLVAIVDPTHAGKQPPSRTVTIAQVRYNQTADVWLEDLQKPQLDLVTVSLGREFYNQISRTKRLPFVVIII